MRAAVAVLLASPLLAYGLHAPVLARPHAYGLHAPVLARPHVRVASVRLTASASTTHPLVEAEPEANAVSGSLQSMVRPASTTVPRRRVAPLPAMLLLGVLILLGTQASLLGRGALHAYRAYEAAAIARPLITKAATSGVAYFLGDAIAQRFSQEKRVDRARLTRATLAGALSHGPQLHYWTVFLEWALPMATLPSLLGKIALDQTCFSLYINAAFCLFNEAMQRNPIRAAIAKARAAAWPCLKAGWRFWPLAHALTYSVVPLHLRVLWVDALEVAWVAILSTCVARAEPDDASSGGAVSGAGDDERTEEEDGQLETLQMDELIGKAVPTALPVAAPA